MDYETLLLRFVVNIIPVISISYVIAGVKLFKQKGENKVNYFALLMFAAAIYSFGYYLELISPSMELMLIFRNFEYFGVMFIPSLGLLFITQFTERRVTGFLQALVLLISAALWLIFLTNPLHSLFYTSIIFYQGQYSVPLTVKGPSYYVLLAFVGVFLIYSDIILIKALKDGGPESRRRSVRFVLIAMMAPWVAVAYILAGFDTYFDIVPATLVVVNGLFLINEVRHDMFTRRIKAKDKLLYVITAVTQGFLETHDFMKVIPEAFRQLGEVLDVSRVYLFRNSFTDGGIIGSVTQTVEWCAENVTAQIGNPELQNMPAGDIGFMLSKLANGEPFYADTRNFEDGPAKVSFQNQSIQSILVLPIISDGVFWGFVGFDECRHERIWTEMEVGVLKLFTSSMTKAIERQHTEMLLMQSEKKTWAILNAIPDVFFIISKENLILDYFTSQDNELYKNSEHFIGSSVRDTFPQNAAPDAIVKVKATLETGIIQTFEYSLEEVPESYYEARVVPSSNDSVLMIVRSISERKKLEIALAQEKNLLETTLVSVGDGVISTDNFGRIIFMNRIAESLTGWTAEEAGSHPIEEVFRIVDEQTQEPCEDSVRKVLRDGEILKLDSHTGLIAKDGSGCPVEGSAAPIVRENGDLIGAVLVFRDFSEKKKRQEEIEYLSFHDQLTGLYNRRYYDQTIRFFNDESFLPLSLVMIDVNGVKIINDAFGHTAGDLLLRRIADVLTRECRAGDVIARIGGDEFVLLLPQTDGAGAEQRIGRIDAALADEKYEKYVLSVSAGFTVRQDLSEDIDTVFKKAEDMMYKNKLSESPEMKTRMVDLIMHALYEAPRERIHSRRVSEICGVIAAKMGYDPDEVAHISLAGLMHDIGKVGIDEKILSRPKTVISGEWSGVERHPEIGYRILNSVTEYTEIAKLVLQHHEHWDGTGYPIGLRADDISMQARIISVADYFDVLTSERNLCETDAVAEIGLRAGSQFDPAVVMILKNLEGQLLGLPEGTRMF